MRPVRKRNRLASYDYSACGTYFITICTAGREKWLWSSEDAGATISRPHAVPLSDAGRTADDAINAIPLHYSTVRVDHYVIMPNHIHLLLTLLPADGRLIAAPTLSQVVGQLKRTISIKTGRSLWQKSFHDHIVRDQHDLEQIWMYIEHNPWNWKTDCFYQKEPLQD